MYWILYKLSKVAKKEKVKRFLSGFFEKFASWSQDETREKLSGVIATVAKGVDKESVDAFIEKFATEKGRLSGNKIASLFKNKPEIKVDMSSYIWTGLSMVSLYVSNLKARSRELVEIYSKNREGFLTREELTKLVNEIIKDAKDNWKAVAIVE